MRSESLLFGNLIHADEQIENRKFGSESGDKVTQVFHLILLEVVGEDVVLSQADTPRNRLLDAHDQPQQCALATAVGACTQPRQCQNKVMTQRCFAQDS